MAGATLTNEGDSSISGNAGAASGNVWNESGDKAEGDRFAQD